MFIIKNGISILDWSGSGLTTMPFGSVGQQGAGRDCSVFSWKGRRKGKGVLGISEKEEFGWSCHAEGKEEDCRVDSWVK